MPMSSIDWIMENWFYDPIRIVTYEQAGRNLMLTCPFSHLYFLVWFANFFINPKHEPESDDQGTVGLAIVLSVLLWEGVRQATNFVLKRWEHFCEEAVKLKIGLGFISLYAIIFIVVVCVYGPLSWQVEYAFFALHCSTLYFYYGMIRFNMIYLDRAIFKKLHPKFTIFQASLSGISLLLGLFSREKSVVNAAVGFMFWFYYVVMYSAIISDFVLIMLDGLRESGSIGEVNVGEDIEMGVVGERIVMELDPTRLH
ncbi:unnamed protein product [Caenorhabditis brenneri]